MISVTTAHGGYCHTITCNEGRRLLQLLLLLLLLTYRHTHYAVSALSRQCRLQQR